MPTPFDFVEHAAQIAGALELPGSLLMSRGPQN